MAFGGLLGWGGIPPPPPPNEIGAGHGMAIIGFMACLIGSACIHVLLIINR